MTTFPFPYTTKVIRDYLAGALPSDGMRVATETPASLGGATPPWGSAPNTYSSLVTITSVPVRGIRNLVLSTRRHTIYCWNSSELEAATLAETVRQLMVDARYAGVGIRDCDFIGEPARLDDPDHPSIPRFQMTCDVLARALTKMPS